MKALRNLVSKKNIGVDNEEEEEENVDKNEDNRPRKEDDGEEIIKPIAKTKSGRSVVVGDD